MTDTFTRVKSILISTLQDKYHKVIALTGKWGTGKTYLWRQVNLELYNKSNVNQRPIYVSLFGVRTINELKLRILQNSHLGDPGVLKSTLKTMGGVIQAVAKKLAGYDPEAVALIWLPNLISNRLIVVDDVERKHKLLDIDELFGVLDEYSEIYGVQFLILLNTDKLIDVELWSTLHEKVIDIEVVLNPSSSECFEVAAQANCYPHLEEVRSAVSTLRVNNIRVIERILRNVKYISEIIGDNAILTTHWVPSTVLLTACHFKSVENPPPFEYIKSFNSFSRYVKKETLKAHELEWEILMAKLGIVETDDYEILIQDYLLSGIVDESKISELFKKYSEITQNSTIAQQYQEFIEAFRWDAHLNERDLLDMAANLLGIANALKAYQITDMVSVIEDLGDKKLAKEFLNRWLVNADSLFEHQKFEESYFNDPSQPLHPAVVAKLNQLIIERHQALTLHDATDRIINNSEWGDRERLVIKRSTPEQYEEVLLSLSGKSLRLFLVEHSKWVRYGVTDENFKCGADNFVVACRKISIANRDSRLARIIFRVFQENELTDKLDL